MDAKDVTLLLESQNNAGYVLRTLPSTRDCEIAKIIGNVETPEEFKKLQAQLGFQHLAVLTCFVERASTMAVRTRDKKYLRLGAVASALTSNVSETRDVILVMPLLWDAAVRLGCTSESILVEVTSLIGRPAASALWKFNQRSDEDKSIAAMGYGVDDEADEADEFVYVRTW